MANFPLCLLGSNLTSPGGGGGGSGIVDSLKLRSDIGPTQFSGNLKFTTGLDFYWVSDGYTSNSALNVDSAPVSFSAFSGQNGNLIIPFGGIITTLLLDDSVGTSGCLATISAARINQLITNLSKGSGGGVSVSTTQVTPLEIAAFSLTDSSMEIIADNMPEWGSLSAMVLSNGDILLSWPGNTASVDSILQALNGSSSTIILTGDSASPTPDLPEIDQLIIGSPVDGDGINLSADGELFCTIVFSSALNLADSNFISSVMTIGLMDTPDGIGIAAKIYDLMVANTTQIVAVDPSGTQTIELSPSDLSYIPITGDAITGDTAFNNIQTYTPGPATILASMGNTVTTN